jgi:hypothetical protein
LNKTAATLLAIVTLMVFIELISLTLTSISQPVKSQSVVAIPQQQQPTSINFAKLFQGKAMGLHRMSSNNASVPTIRCQNHKRVVIDEDTLIKFPIHNVIQLPSTVQPNNYQLWQTVDIVSIALVIAVVIDRLT